MSTNPRNQFSTQGTSATTLQPSCRWPRVASSGRKRVSNDFSSGKKTSQNNGLTKEQLQVKSVIENLKYEKQRYSWIDSQCPQDGGCYLLGI
jgi:hypothetical protein